MAFYIDLEKIEENDETAKYKFYTSAENVGIIEIIKSNGDVVEIEPAPNDRGKLLFQRSAWALMKHWRKNEYPKGTYWAS